MRLSRHLERHAGDHGHLKHEADHGEVQGAVDLSAAELVLLDVVIQEAQVGHGVAVRSEFDNLLRLQLLVEELVVDIELLVLGHFQNIFVLDVVEILLGRWVVLWFILHLGDGSRQPLHDDLLVIVRGEISLAPHLILLLARRCTFVRVGA